MSDEREQAIEAVGAIDAVCKAWIAAGIDIAGNEAAIMAFNTLAAFDIDSPSVLQAQSAELDAARAERDEATTRIAEALAVVLFSGDEDYDPVIVLRSVVSKLASEVPHGG